MAVRGNVSMEASPLPHFGLTAELERLRSDARAFAQRLHPRAVENEWRPIHERIDWEMVEEASRLGWRTMGLPVSDGGGGASALALCVLIEELAAGDMGFAVILDQTLKVQRIVARAAYEMALGHASTRVQGGQP